jgi:3',5'-cyclic AMP phosphodiesterase CpdA
MILAQLTDLHIRPLGHAANRNAETNMLTERALRSLAHMSVRPDAVLITGDLTDDGTEEEYELLSDLLHRYIGAPIYAIPGNHDSRTAMKTVLSHLPGICDDPEFIHYTVEHLPQRLVMLDTLIPGSGAGELCDRRLEWLDATLAAAPTRPTMIAMHHPPFATGIPFMDAIGLRNAAEFAELLSRHAQVERIVSGHIHRAVTTKVAHAVASVAPSVAHQIEFALGDEPGAWNLEPPVFQLHVLAEQRIVSHTIYVEPFAGPFPFGSN